LKYAKLNTVTTKVIEKQTARMDATAAESARYNMRFITMCNQRVHSDQ
jgi:hypothetical protein